MSRESFRNSTSNRPIYPHKSLESFNPKSSINEPKAKDTEDSRNPPSVIGTCPDMCPAKERSQRERLRDLSVFERLNGNPSKTSPSLAVKKFCRTISTSHMQSSDIRPLQVLQDTLDYLINLLDSSQYPFEVVHDFVFDRTRSIRQDLSVQNITNDQAVQMYEDMVKFHIMSHHKIKRCSSDPNTSSLHYLNMEQLGKSLMSLYNLYQMNRKSGSVNKNEAEFYSFYVLLHLGSNMQSMGESLSVWFWRLASPILKSKEMRFARSVLRCFRMGNYRRFLSTTAFEASYLQFCLIEPFINEVRAQAISYINYCGYKLHAYPIACLAKPLMMKESEAESLCNLCGLETTTDEKGNKVLPTKQTCFSLPKGGFENYSFSGSEWLTRAELENREECFDVIIGDLADPIKGGPCYQLYTKSFYESTVKPRLSKGGIFVTQASDSALAADP